MKRFPFPSLPMAFLWMAIMMLAGCGRPTVPDEAQALDKKADIFPDYSNIVIPCNIAPLNFMVRDKGDAFAVRWDDGNGDQLTAVCGNDGILQYDMEEWHGYLGRHKGQSMTVTVYKQVEGQWYQYPRYNIAIAEDSIDEYLSYRLIEPGYEIYRLLGLYQRNLTNFDVKTIIENPRLTYVENKTYCINCHNYQNYSTKRMLFHARSSFGGTIIAEDGKIEKLSFKNDSILGSAVYPSWHPRKNWIIFSSNKTGQVFRIKDKQKVEVLDHASDIIFYNADKHEVSNVIKTHSILETFPAWSPDGKYVYYCVSTSNIVDGDPDSIMDSKIIAYSHKLKYNIMRIPFDESTMTFGTPELVFDAKAINKSASVPRISPDGRYLLFTLGDFGQFHIWHSSSDLYVKDLETGRVYSLKAANSSNVDSYHAWSSNSRWIVFSSRRDDGSFTRTYITYFDKKGVAHKAFMLPQEDPTYNLRLFKSFNVPELTKDAVPYTSEQFDNVIRNEEAVKVSYKRIE